METEKITQKHKRTNLVKNYLVPAFIFLFLVSLIVLYKSLYLSFPDDDWLAILIPKTTEAPLFSPYGFQQNSFKLLYELIGYNPFWFYFLSLFLRTLTGTTIFLFVLRFTRDKLSSALSAILFVVGFTGLETTEVVNNINTYSSGIFLIIFLYIFFTDLERRRIKNFILGIIMLTLSFITAPIRVFAFPMWFIFLSFFFLAGKLDKVLKIITVKWVLMIVTIFVLLIRLGMFGGTTSSSSSFLGNVERSINIISQSLGLGEKRYFRYFVTGISNVILPDKITAEIKIKPLRYPQFWFGSLYFFLGAYYFLHSRKKIFRLPLTRLTLAFFTWVPFFYFASWIVWLEREEVLVSTRRYLTIPYLGFCILSGLIISQVTRKTVTKKVLLSIPIIIIFLHIITTYDYFNQLRISRDANFDKIIIKELQTKVPSLSRESLSYFYFDFNDVTGLIHRSLIVGFTTKMAILYDLPKTTPPINPHSTNSFDEFFSVVTDGQALVKHGYPPQPIPWENVYVFRVEKDKLIDIKEDIKKKVEVRQGKI